MYDSSHVVRLALLLAAAAPSAAQAQERVHSDLPLFTGRHDELSPHSFFEKDKEELSLGCVHRVPMGDWKYVEPDESRNDPRIRWMRLHNYGAFHCASYERWSNQREGLEFADAKPSWLVELGSVTINNTKVDLWTLQTGSRPGSDYLLLSRQPAKGLIKQFNVLPVDCPKRFTRKGKSIDVWRVDYCVADSVAELRSLAKEMAKRAPVGTLTFEGDAPEDKD